MALVKAKLVVAVLAVVAFGSGAVLLERPAATATPVPTTPAEPTIEELKRENERLRREVADLKKRLAVHEGSAAGKRDDDPPTDAAVLRAMPKAATEALTGTPDITIVKEKLVDRLEPPREFPLVGTAQLRHRHWECKVYYTETVQSDYPFPVKVREPRVQVVYVDQDTLVRVAGLAK